MGGKGGSCGIGGSGGNCGMGGKGGKGGRMADPPAYGKSIAEVRARAAEGCGDGKDEKSSGVELREALTNVSALSAAVAAATAATVATDTGGDDSGVGGGVCGRAAGKAAAAAAAAASLGAETAASGATPPPGSGSRSAVSSVSVDGCSSTFWGTPGGGGG